MVKRGFGLEIESFGLTKDILKNTITGVPTLKWKDNLHTHGGGVFFDRKTWQGMADGSIRSSGRHGTFLSTAGRNTPGDKKITHEIVSPVLKGGKGMKDAEKVLRGLTKAGAEVNSSTGLHVTFGLDNSRWKRMGRKKRAKTLARIVDSYNYFLPGIDQMVPKSRRGAYYAQPRGLRGSLHHKYSLVNLKQFSSGARVEFRQGAGTTNPKKVREWVNFLDKLLNFSTNEEFKNRKLRDYPRTFEGMAKAFGLNDAQKTYWRKRITTLGGSSTTELAPSGEYPRPLNWQPTDLTRFVGNISPNWAEIEDFQRRHGRVD